MSTRRTATASNDSCQRDVEAPPPSDRTSRGYRALIVSNRSLFDILSVSSRVPRMFVLASSHAEYVVHTRCEGCAACCTDLGVCCMLCARGSIYFIFSFCFLFSPFTELSRDDPAN